MFLAVGIGGATLLTKKRVLLTVRLKTNMSDFAVVMIWTFESDSGQKGILKHNDYDYDYMYFIVKS